MGKEKRRRSNETSLPSLSFTISLVRAKGNIFDVKSGFWFWLLTSFLLGEMGAFLHEQSPRMAQSRGKGWIEEERRTSFSIYLSFSS